MSRSSASFPIVGIGASAGGIAALEGLFRSIPPDSGLGYVVVTHLNPERVSLLDEVVGRYTSMPVATAVDGLRVEPNRVFVLPANVILSIEDGCLRVTKPNTTRRNRKPIDVFLAALAKDQGEHAAGIILSGSDGDGTLGIKAIKERGGLTMAQASDGDGPEHADMPQSAIATGLVDFPLPVHLMGDRLVEFARSFELLDNIKSFDDSLESQPGANESIAEIYDLLRRQVGHDFSGYKSKTFLRRVRRRMEVVQLTKLADYTNLLKGDSKEVAALFRDLLINVTNFFRDAEAFDALKDLVIPKLFEGRSEKDTVRVWVPGCSTGEEVYSIGILLSEYMEATGQRPKVQIYATDIDDLALSIARTGHYPEALLDSVSEERRQRYFTFDAGAYTVSKQVRDLCIFSPHSLIRDPPFSRNDLVSCRNLLIYFGPEVQGHVIPTFHYSLRPGGYLFLGTSENITQFPELFAPVDKKCRIFRSRDVTAALQRLPAVIDGLRRSPFDGDQRNRKVMPKGFGLRQVAETQVLERFAPAHVVINRDGDVVHYSPRTNKYLEIAPGVPTRQLVAMSRKSLRLELRTAVREAVETERPVVREGVALESDDGRVQLICITVEPLSERNEADPLFLVVFQDEGTPHGREDVPIVPRGSADDAILHVERELRDTRERLQSLIEEYETALEELKSSNEELVSVNEELQSANEEMEASKEELQSLNEELHTVNNELTEKVDALDAAHSDLQNLFESTQIATVFLDRSLVIRMFTPAVSQIFNIRPNDKGRPLTDLASRLALPALHEDVAEVLAHGSIIERRIEQDGGAAHFLVRQVPYRDSSGKIEGVVVSFVDVTSMTRAASHQQVLIAELNHRVKNMLAIVIAIANQTLRTAPSPEAFKAAFVERLHAMARSYELLSREHWTEASIEELIRQQIDPFGAENVKMSGPSVRLKPKQALSMGMILHELATNAAKYGSLHEVGGRVDVTWALTAAAQPPSVVVTWKERGGTPIDEPVKRGFGLKLVELETSHGLRGSADLQFEHDGLVATLTFPNTLST